MSETDNKQLAKNAIAMLENLAELDKEIRAAIEGCFRKGNVSFVSIIGMLERHKQAVMAEAMRQEVLHQAQAAKAKSAGAIAK